MKLQNQYSINAGKKQVLKLSYYYYLAYASSGISRYQMRSNRTFHCSDIISGYMCPQCGTFSKFITYGCQDRLCPICATKQSHVAAAQARSVYASIRADHPLMHAALITLTIKNCDSSSLNDCIENLINAWRRFTKMRIFNRLFKGWARSLEITYNKKENTFHPHLHIIALHDGIMPRADIIKSLWREAIDADYDPIIDIRKARNNRAIIEISKYICKSSTLLSYDDNSYAIPTIAIEDAIYGRRLRSWGGLWAKYRKLLNMKSDENMSEHEINKALSDIDKSSTICKCGTEMIYGSMWWAGFESRYYFKAANWNC